MKQVICNRARETCLCGHSMPHDVYTHSNDGKCTKWGTCFEFPEGQETPVRCTKVKEGK
jgi:hypothetical protein